MLKRFFKDSLLYSFGGFAAKGASLLLVPVYTQILSPADYGTMDMMKMVAAIALLTVALEVTQAVARFYPESEDKNTKAAYVSTGFWFSLGTYGFFALLGLLFSTPLSEIILDTSSNVIIFRVAILGVFLNGIFRYFKSQLKWQLRSKIFLIASLSALCLDIAATLFCMLNLNMGVLSIFIGQIFASLGGCGVAYFCNRSVYRLQFNIPILKEMLRFSWPLVPSGIGIFISMYTDRLVIKEMLSLHELGVYGIAFRFASIMSLVFLGIRYSLLPLVFHQLKNKNTPGEINKIFQYVLFLLLVILLFLSIFSKEIIELLTSPEFYPSYTVMPLLAVAAIFTNIYVFAPGIIIAKRTKYIAYISIGTAVVNLCLNLLLIPVWGISGAALATVLSSFLGLWIQFFLSQRYYYIPFEWSKVFVSTLLAGILIGIGYNLSFSFILQISIKSIIILTGAFIIPLILIGPQNIKSLLKFSSLGITKR